MEMDRLTRSRKPMRYDRPAAASRAYLRRCRTMEWYVDKAADKIMECKWRTRKVLIPQRKTWGGRVLPAETRTTTEPDKRTVEYIGECVAEVTDWDGDWDMDSVEAYADRVALEVLKRHGYRVAADADYDWVWDNLGRNAEDIYSTAWGIVAEDGPSDYCTDRY